MMKKLLLLGMVMTSYQSVGMEKNEKRSPSHQKAASRVTKYGTYATHNKENFFLNFKDYDYTYQDIFHWLREDPNCLLGEIFLKNQRIKKEIKTDELLEELNNSFDTEKSFYGKLSKLLLDDIQIEKLYEFENEEDYIIQIVKKNELTKDHQENISTMNKKKITYSMN